MDMNKLGAFLQSLRKEHGMTQEQLGEKLHVSGKTISRWETGAYMPPVESLLALSELYGLSVNELVAGERLTPEAQPAQAEANLVAVMKENELFHQEDRKDFWEKKWLREHLLLIVAIGVLFLATQIAGGLMDRVEINAVSSILTVCAAAWLRNRRDDYVEHHLYDE